MARNIILPNTDIVGCKFVYKTNGVDDWQVEQNIRDTASAKEYYYRLIPGIEVKKGDTVVVCCSTGFQVVKVTSVNVLTDSARAYVVGKVDIEQYNEFIENEKKKASLLEALKRKKKELEGLLAFEILADRCPEFKEMLEAFKELGGTVE